MIAKHISMRALKKSDFAGLLHYLLGLQNKHERVGEVRVTNCQSTDPAMAAIEVLNTQAMNLRATGDKTYHLVLSFRAGEQPDAAVLQALEERVCGALGYGEHQRVSVVHHDTDNLHVHIAINKIHPVRHTMFSPYNDHITLGKVCQTLEREFGLQLDNHTARKHRAENQAGDMEQHAGVESLLGWIKRECWQDLASAASWSALHDIMAAHGLHLHERGNGLVITADDGTTIKASSLDRQFSKARLEARLGPFQPGSRADGNQNGKPAGKRYERKPIGFHTDTTRLYKRYQSQRGHDDQGDARAEEWDKARECKDSRIADAKCRGAFKRAAIKLLACDRCSKRFLFAAVGRTLQSDIARINREYFKERQRIYQKYKSGTWADWLHDQACQGNDEALSALRSRQNRGVSGDNTLAGQQHGARAQSHRQGFDSITKHGTVIICAGTTVLRDNGRNLAVTRGFDEAGLQAALGLARERYGACLKVDGSDDFRERIARAAASAQLSITFDDAALEARRLELMRAATTKEASDETRQQPGPGRSAGSGIPANGRGSAAGAAGEIGTAGETGTARTADEGAGSRKPDVGGVGKKPPPQSRNRLRRLSQLGVVRLPGGSAVLLPGDVPGHVEQQGSAADHRVRRPVSGTGRLKGAEDAATAMASAQAKGARRRAGRKPPAAHGNRLRDLHDLDRNAPVLDRQAADAGAVQGTSGKTGNTPPSPPVARHETSATAAAAKYVFEREQRRVGFFDIPKHLAYDGFQGQAAFAGLRTIDGQQLALIKRGDDIVVVPVDETVAKRLRRVARGDMVTVAAQGAIKIKGRSQ